eukprot:UN31287
MQLDYMKQVRDRIKKKDRDTLLNNIKLINKSFKPKIDYVYNFTSNEKLMTQCFDKDFLEIIKLAQNGNVKAVKSKVSENIPNVFMIPCFNKTFCDDLINELRYCATETIRLNLPVRKANVRNNKGVVLNDFGSFHE